MKIEVVFQFLVSELRKAISDNAKERILELGSSVDILYEIAKSQNDKKALNILEKLNYIVFHHDEEFSFVEKYFQEIEKTVSQN
jgi:hypothetical protein